MTALDCLFSESAGINRYVMYRDVGSIPVTWAQDDRLNRTIAVEITYKWPDNRETCNSNHDS